MDGLKVVELAKQKAHEYFSGESVQRLGLEELEYDEIKNLWYITLSFERKWENTQVFGNSERVYKKFEIDDRGEKLVRITTVSTE